MQTLVVVAALLLSSVETVDTTLKTGRPIANAPVDCNLDYQPCTGTECVPQQKTYICDDADNTGQVVYLLCGNDTQTYTGGNSVCCVGNNFCGNCMLRGRNYRVYSYDGVTMRSCGKTQ